MRHGFLLIAKKAGPTSHDIVGMVRKRLGERNIGHLGALDPAAEGLMVLAVGSKALKVVELFNGLPKTYEGTIRLGAVSTTFDGEGVITETPRKPGWEAPEQGALQRLIADNFLGKIEQIPPQYSAVHVGGERAYRRVMRGEQVVMPSRKVEVTRCDILSWAWPRLTLRIACSAGTYIRSIAHDLGQLMRCGAYLAYLKRTKIGDWDISGAVDAENCAWTDVKPLKDILEESSSTELTDNEWEDIQHGRMIGRMVKPDVIAWHAGLPVAILIPVPGNMEQSRARKVL